MPPERALPVRGAAAAALGTRPSLPGTTGDTQLTHRPGLLDEGFQGLLGASGAAVPCASMLGRREAPSGKDKMRSLSLHSGDVSWVWGKGQGREQDIVHPPSPHSIRSGGQHLPGGCSPVLAMTLARPPGAAVLGPGRELVFQ